MRKILIAGLLLLGTTHAQQQGPALPAEVAGIAAQRYCAVRMLPDYHFGFSYFARLRLSPTCPAGAVGRVRKTSTLSTKAKGARYQPVKPDGSAQYGGLFSWTLTRNGDNIPNGEEWTWNRWRWEYWDGSSWRPAQ
ncbi:hypothetical protein [Deinococcus sp. Marseille-Q6407]|uniref:hypothetical protein n=1 Tax=Deinococcus sp. Marseille-Q6407 TaxID=2969223 RepID=UPI0021BEBFC1|nr:hypothetical protein [Deinococcus sp. Marseille-Q6407]